MGFRCPCCGNDFGHDKDAFTQHIESSIVCKNNTVSTLYHRMKNELELSESILQTTNEQKEEQND